MDDSLDHPSAFTKWVMGLFTIILIGVAAWMFHGIEEVKAATIENKFFIQEIRLDMAQAHKDIEQLKDLQLKLLAAEELARIELRKQEQARRLK